MADRYWVGGSGNWSDTNRWAASSGGTPGASVPTSADNVIFDAASNGAGTGAFTVTVDGTSASPSRCADFSTGGAGGALDGAMTLSMGATAQLDCYGSMTIPATNFSFSTTSGAVINFSTTGSSTLTSNGVTFGATNLVQNGTGTITLGSALTNTGLISVQSGTFTTSNFNVTTAQFAIQNASSKTINLGSSTFTISGASPVSYTGSNATLNAGTSTITCSSASPTFNGGGLTFYNVTFSNAGSGTTTINGANTFNNLTQTSRSATGNRNLVFGANQTVSGTLTLGAANTAIRRIQATSDTIGTQRTLTLNGTLATLADVDFRDIVAAGTAGTWTGTRLGNGLNNGGITFDLPKTVYWNLAGTQNWSATGWATTNNGSPAANNFPLAQDTAVFTEAGAAGTVTIELSWWIGSIQMADGVSNRTTSFTLTNASNPFIYGDVTLFSNLTLTGGGTITFANQGLSKTITSAGVSFTQSIVINAPSGTVKLGDNLTNTGTSFTLTQGTIDLNNKVLTCVAVSSSNSNTRSIAFGTGNITVTGNNATVLAMSNITGFTYTGTPEVNFTYSGSTGTRTLQFGGGGGLLETNAININITAGSDTVAMGSAKNIILTGFSGTFSNPSGGRTLYGNLVISTGMTVASGANITTFAATSGTQKVTTNGVTLDFPITVNAPGATVSLVDALTQGPTRNFTLTNGTVQFKNNVTSTVGNFVTSGTSQKFLQSTTLGSQATLSEAAGTVNASNLVIRDINATGGAIWNAFVDQGNVDAGNNDGWDFGISPIVGAYEYTYQLRSFTQPRRF